MGWINGENGWRQLEPPNCIPAPHDKTMLEEMGINNPGPYNNAVIDQACNIWRRWRLPVGDPRRIISPPGTNKVSDMLKERNWIPEWNTPALQVEPYYTPEPVVRTNRHRLFEVKG